MSDPRLADPATRRLISRPPSVSTRITADGGRVRYRVMAYRPLSHAEMVDTVVMALDRGWIAEPDVLEEAVIFTSIGAVPGRRAGARAASPPAATAVTPGDGTPPAPCTAGRPASGRAALRAVRGIESPD